MKKNIASYGDYPDLGSIKKILVVKLRHLGDVLLATAVLKVLKERFPEAEIDAYVYKESLPMLEGHPAISRLIGYDTKVRHLNFYHRIREEIRCLQEIRKNRYDLTLNLTEGDRGVIASFFSGAKIRVGMTPKGKYQKKMLTHLAKECSTPRHVVEKNLDVLRRIGIFPSSQAKELYFYIPEEAKEKIARLVGNQLFILIHPTSRWLFKCWPPLKVRELVQALLKEGKRIVLTSGPNPKEKEIIRMVGRELDVLSFEGTFSLKELGALIQQSEMLICVDSVAFHIASALKKRVIALFGPTSEVGFGPWRNPHAQIVSMPFSCRPCHLDGCGGSKKSDCLESLPVEKVLEKIRVKNDFLDKVFVCRN